MHAVIHSIKVVDTIICLHSIFALDFAKSVVSVHRSVRSVTKHSKYMALYFLLRIYWFDINLRVQIFITGESGDIFEFFFLYTHKLIKIAHEWVRWYDTSKPVHLLT